MSERLMPETAIKMTSERSSREMSKFAKDMIQYRGDLIKYAQQLLGEKTKQRSAEDIVQTAFVKALERQNEFGQGDNLRAWLYTVVRNEVFGDKRKDVRRPQASLSELENIPVEHDPSLDIHREQMRKKLQAAIAALSPEHAEVITLVMSGCPHTEGARQLGLNYNTYKTRIRHAQERLRDLLNEAGVGLTEV